MHNSRLAMHRMAMQPHQWMVDAGLESADTDRAVGSSCSGQ